MVKMLWMCGWGRLCQRGVLVARVTPAGSQLSNCCFFVDLVLFSAQLRPTKTRRECESVIELSASADLLDTGASMTASHRHLATSTWFVLETACWPWGYQLGA